MRMVKVTQNILSLKMVVKNGAKLATVQSLKKKNTNQATKKKKKLYFPRFMIIPT